MKLTLSIRNETPPDYFRYTHPETGHLTKCADMTGWLQQIADYRALNNLPPVDPADAIDQLCKLLPPGWCVYEDGSAPKFHVNTRLGVMDIYNGTKVLALFMAGGYPLVSQELAESRSITCARCPMNVELSGCQPCVGMQSLADSIAGGIKTTADPQLKSCAICHCHNKAQTRIPIEILAKGVTPEQREKFESVPWCWKGKELAAIGQ